MLVVISPAKTLDFESETRSPDHSEPAFMKDTRALIKTLRKKEVPEIQKLMSLSDKLAELNFQRYKSFRSPHKPENAKPALEVFKGDVYVGLDADSFEEADFVYAQDHLRILSGLYGLLRPMDLIQPYRLEMGTKLETERGKNLYQFWGDKLTRRLKRTMKETGSEILVNLASKEYFSALDAKKLKVRVITPNFLDWKGDKYKMISFFAKKARGMMTRYILQNRIEDPEGLKGFDFEGYSFNSEMSEGDNLVFTRNQEAAVTA